MEYFLEEYFEEESFSELLEDQRFNDDAKSIYRFFFKKPVNELPAQGRDFVNEMYKYFLDAQWYHVYDFVEFLYRLSSQGSVNQQSLKSAINHVLEQEKAAYRIIGGVIAPLTNEIEIAEIERAANKADRFSSVAVHIHSALDHYRKRPVGDYRNTIKEAILAVESASKIIAGKPDVTLGEAIKEIDKKHVLHGAFREGLLKIYGYTSDSAGIRHGMFDSSSSVDEADARYMLVVCSAFVNFLITRYAGP